MTIVSPMASEDCHMTATWPSYRRHVPEMRFEVRWPDGSRREYYSPSLVVEDYLKPGQAYPLADFVGRSREALRQASERVRAAYGMPCSLAAASLERIERAAATFADGEVRVQVPRCPGRADQRGPPT